ncbi:MAG: CDP-glycerol glycerophosphotransferase family protein [Bacteroidales bacterium]
MPGSTFKAKYGGHYKYSVIVSVNNTEIYLDDFFKSLVCQTLDFENHIQLILINEGTEDRPAKIIRTWQKKYPKNILYIKKETDTQLSAKNLGLKYATGDWVTLINPNDFFDFSYFKKVDEFARIYAHNNLSLLSCKIIIYYEDEAIYQDLRTIKYLYQKGDRILPVNDSEDFFQPNLSNTFLKLDKLRASNLEVEDRITPGFRDGHLISRYLLMNPDTSIGIISKARYYNRIRTGERSALDKNLNLLDYRREDLELDSLSILNESKDKLGSIPQWLQRIVLYHLTWKIFLIVDNSGSQQPNLGEKDKVIFNLLRKLIVLIDDQVIANFQRPRFTDIHKVGISGLLKQRDNISSEVHVESCDKKRKMLKLSYSYYGARPAEEFFLGNEKVTPAFSKEIGYRFFDHTYSSKVIFWIPYATYNLKNNLTVKINRVLTNLTIRQNISNSFLELEKIICQLTPGIQNNDVPFRERTIRYLARTKVISSYYHKAWLFMDRDIQADDNAEHLYRFIQKQHPDVNAFFVVRKSSTDWLRLQKAGFRLIEFNSLKHKLALLNTQNLISSYFDDYIVNYLEKRYYQDMVNHDFTFLRHGISIGDMSKALNKKPIDLLISSSPKEYHSIVDDGSPYNFCEKEVTLTGLPRHDNLLKKQFSQQKIILIMPTWRKWLAGELISKGNVRQINTNFYQSQFARRWKQFIHSAELKEISERNNYQIVFFPHLNLEPYIKWFETPGYIKVKHHSDYDTIQQLFQESSILITDYSSVSFEMAYLQKPVIYYQFDQKEMYAGSHIAKKGYFDFEQDGFGPVCKDLTSLLKAIDDLFGNHGQPDPKYLARMNNTFAFRDGKCCERVANAIFSLEQ